MNRGRPRKRYVTIEPPAVDWKRVMHELEERGLTPYKVAQHLGCSTPAAQNWAEGGEPRYSYGSALLILHRQATQ